MGFRGWIHVDAFRTRAVNDSHDHEDPTMQRVPERDLRYDPEEAVYYYGDHPFTGIAYTTYPNGGPMSEAEYRDGVFFGVSRGWWESGKPETEANYAFGALHGPSRSWHANGQLAEDELHEHGILIRSKRWDEQGSLIEEYQLDESDPSYEALLRSRAAYDDER